ncbi:MULTISPECIES: aminopeptidase [unclassified Breznakia]|uniref:aminopeptidase n=1 Tax=unclassified Breznakia TaxID=2623764 RepID=UPI002475AB7E|nr:MULTISPECIES: aminopeptidase [unclassified Breznakia]MDH6366286.1 aminopeptidase [Breznakia sp. PH1-1]MDH6403379.1 aminopeptidase [Breznakia sp. PF1-11]MDH6411088.1 aminopeptidase [Breznakia sp. PFB1-11]MDH6413452.1 aminopeptidase [Breznakia sp. PFB1-14]MDH6416759.1 aminopeptidase [Breznakia sp. PFB1-4]
MLSKTIIEKYAKLAVRSGVNVQPGQTMVINAPVNTRDMIEACVKEGYEAGAKEVIVNFYDEKINRMHYEYQSVETLTDIPDYLVEQKVAPLRNGGCVLHIISEIPEVMAGLDATKLQEVGIARQKAFRESSEITMASKVQWSIVGYPNVDWAKKVFPNEPEEVAMMKLGDAICNSVQVLEDNDPIEFWKEHDENLRKYVNIMNDYNFKSLHFKNELGTDLTVELVKNHIWAGGDEATPGGVMFNANMPTEEVFTMPYKYGMNGKVVSTKPLSYNGSLINQFELTFKDGKVVEYKAENNEDVLQSLIEFDEGSSYTGEIALVPYHSPISMSNILFYNTLYDENASCHIALGRAYPMNVKDGTIMTQEQLDAVGSNNSMTHVDFMFGTEDLEIIGTTHDGNEIPVFKKGDFAF